MPDWRDRWPGNPSAGDRSRVPGIEVAGDNDPRIDYPVPGFDPDMRQYAGTGPFPNAVDPNREFIRPISPADYGQVMMQMFSEQAAINARLLMLVDLARDKRYSLRIVANAVGTGSLTTGITAPGDAVNIPDGPWMSLRVTRPTQSEMLQGKAFPQPVIVLVDDEPFLVPQYGQTIIPVYQPKSVQVVAASAPPAGWALDLVFSSKVYMPTDVFSLTTGQAGAAGTFVAGVPVTPLNAVNQQTGGAGGTATLTGAPGQTTYMTGFMVDGLGATGASVVEVTTTGILGGTIRREISVPAGVGIEIPPLVVSFGPVGVPSSVVGGNIAVVVPSLGAGNVNLVIQANGYRQ